MQFCVLAESADMICSFQLLNLLDVIIDSAGSMSSSSDKSQISTEAVVGPQISAMEVDVNIDSVTSSALDASPHVHESSKPTPPSNKECPAQQVLCDLPQAELQLLCSLLAQEGYGYGYSCRLKLLLLSVFYQYALIWCI